MKRLCATRKATGTPVQARQVMTQLRIHTLYSVGLALIWHRRMLSGIVEQFLVGSHQVTVVQMRSRTLIHQLLQGSFVSLLAQHKANNATAGPLYESAYVPSVFFRSTKVCNSSISTICRGSSVGVGAGGS